MQSQFDCQFNYNSSFKVNQSVQDTGGKINARFFVPGSKDKDDMFRQTMRIRRDRSINFIINLSNKNKSNPETSS